MKLIIAGSRTFTDYQRLCQVLAPDRHRIAQVITGGARGADQLGYRWAWKHAIRHQLFRADWERFGKPLACAATTRWRRPATCSSRSGMGGRQAQPTWCSACASWANRWWSSVRMIKHKKSAWHVSRRFSPSQRAPRWLNEL